jgi:hypothetical protein
MRPVGFQIEDGSAVWTPADLIYRKEVQDSSKWNADRVSSREFPRGNETRPVETGPLGGQDRVIGRRLEWGEQARGDADKFVFEVVAKNPADGVLPAIVSSGG